MIISYMRESPGTNPIGKALVRIMGNALELKYTMLSDAISLIMRYIFSRTRITVNFFFVVLWGAF